MEGRCEELVRTEFCAREFLFFAKFWLPDQGVVRYPAATPEGWIVTLICATMVEVDSGYNTTINRFDGGVPRCKVELNASVEVDESFTY